MAVVRIACCVLTATLAAGANTTLGSQVNASSPTRVPSTSIETPEEAPSAVPSPSPDIEAPSSLPTPAPTAIEEAVSAVPSLYSRVPSAAPSYFSRGPSAAPSVPPSPGLRNVATNPPNSAPTDAPPEPSAVPTLAITSPLPSTVPTAATTSPPSTAAPSAQPKPEPSFAEKSGDNDSSGKKSSSDINFIVIAIVLALAALAAFLCLLALVNRKKRMEKPVPSQVSYLRQDHVVRPARGSEHSSIADAPAPNFDSPALSDAERRTTLLAPVQAADDEEVSLGSFSSDKMEPALRRLVHQEEGILQDQRCASSSMPSFHQLAASRDAGLVDVLR